MANPDISFALICEGPSDDALVSVLEQLLVAYGASEARGFPDNRKGSVSEKLTRLQNESGVVDLVFIHRDADNAGYDARLDEISYGWKSSECSIPCIPVIPVTMTEAWLLADAELIEEVVGFPPVDLPKVANIESIADPKTRLQRIISESSGQRGRRLRKENERFNAYRRLLISGMRIDGPLQQLPSWQLLTAAIGTHADTNYWTR